MIIFSLSLFCRKGPRGSIRINSSLSALSLRPPSTRDSCPHLDCVIIRCHLAVTSLLGFLLSYEPIGEPIDEDDRRRCGVRVFPEYFMTLLVVVTDIHTYHVRVLIS